MLLFQPGADEAQEWLIAQGVVRAAMASDPGAWSALAQCPFVEAYTDGSAPVRNPGGPAGFAAILVGFEGPVSLDSPERPAPAARLDLGGFVPKRKSEPLTSNNRAEIGGIMCALEALRHLAGVGWKGQQATIWSDSKYAVFCANRIWKRKKNTDLWTFFDPLAAAVRGALPKGRLLLEWVKGHAGNEYNEVADKLATLAAFNFDEATYARFRAAQAQAATGDGRPLAVMEGSARYDTPPDVAPESSPVNSWLGAADYALVLLTRFTVKDVNAGTGEAAGEYRVWSRDGRSRTAVVSHTGHRLHDEAEYLTLVAALREMIGRMETAGRDPRESVLRVSTSRELVAKQLKGEYRVKAPALQTPYREARALLDRFKRAEIDWKKSRDLEALAPL